ncbi:MAG: ABC transporter permease [Chloroflexi bacterium]|nr:ABC transporter permease [Chloroflexota bacterium]
MAAQSGPVSAPNFGARPRPRMRVRLVRFARSKPLGALGACLLLVTVSVVLLGDLLARYPSEQVFSQAPLHPPSAEFWFGTDNLARDIYSRIVYGSRISLFVGFSVVASGSLLGAALGIVSAYLGGKADLVIQRVVDGMMAIPGLFLALAIMSALGQSLANVIIALAITQIPGTSRTIRSVALSVKEMQYVEAGRAMGATPWRIMWQHVAINCVPPFIIVASASLGSAILAEASLSFLGVGAPGNIPSWGGMLGGDNRRYMVQAPWMAIFPGFALSLTVYGINLLGDALRDILDPRLRGSQ